MEFNAITLKSELAAALKIPKSKISVRQSAYSIRVVFKQWCDLEKAKTIAKRFERIDRCQHTGEILQGGNTFVSVQFDSSLELSTETLAKLDAIVKDNLFIENHMNRIYLVTSDIESAFGCSRYMAQDILSAYQRSGSELAKYV